MKLGEIKALVERGGVLNLTALDSDSKVAYKVFTFRKAVSKAYEGLQEQEQELLKECDIDVKKDFDKEGNFKFEGEESNDKWERFSKLREEMFDSEVSLDVPKVNYEEWFLVYKENRTKVSLFVENALEDIFWTEAEEADVAK